MSGPTVGLVPAAQLLSGERVLVCDGAMGTMLHAAGAALDRSLPELNLSDPGLVATIHDSYLSAGADIIQANTFGANRLWLADHGFPDKVAEINRAGMRLARAAADRSGSGGAGIRAGGRVGLARRDRAAAPPGRRGRADGGAQGADPGAGHGRRGRSAHPGDLRLPGRAGRGGLGGRLGDFLPVRLPLIAQATFADDAHTLGGETPREVATVLSGLPVTMIGTNCTIGPQRMLTIAEDLVRYSAVPVSAQPNAGQPRRTGPRSFEFAIDGGYFSRYLARFADAGVTVVGGCCGTTPTHIRAAAEALRTSAVPRARATATARAADAAAAKPAGPQSAGAPQATPLPAQGQASGSLAEQLASRRFVVAAALTPPAGGWAGDTERAAAELADRGIGLVLVEPRDTVRTHLDSLNMALQLQQRVGVETIATVTTWDKTIMSLQADLLGAHALGIRSVVCTTGSPPVFGDYPAVDGTWEVDSVGLTALLAGLNAGRDSNGLALTSRMSFCIGARINPGARDQAAELDRAHAKIRAGAQYLVSRPVHDLDALTRVAEALDGTGVPLLLSVAPLTSFEEADYLAHEVPGVTIPAATLEAMERAGRSGGRAVGLELAATVLAKARPLVSGVILAASGDDPSALEPLLDALS